MNHYVVLDIETTGTHPIRHEIIEIGAVYVEDGQVVKTFNELICPKEPISEYITGITGIDNDMVANAPSIDQVLPRFLEFCGTAPLIGHNIILFDYRMLKSKAVDLGLAFERSGLDTLIISRKMLAELPSRKLGALCEHYGISLEHAHRAFDDAYATYKLYQYLEEQFAFDEPKLFVPQPMIWEKPKVEPITAKQKKYLENLCTRHGIPVEADIATLSKSEASRKIDQIISTYGKMMS